MTRKTPRKTPVLAACLAVAANLFAAPAAAQPDMSRMAPVTIADRGSDLYRFAEETLASRDGARAYRLRIGIPRRPPGPRGYPLVWLLDGKAALAHVDEALLRDLDAATPPVIVAVGHDTALRLDAAERILDYTPGKGSADGRGRPGGGADDFLDLISGEMTQRVAALAPVDRTQQTIWGHSLGGLFVLHALLTRPGSFARYYAASPSLWWNDGAIVRALAEQGDRTDRRCPCTVIAGIGESELKALRSASPGTSPRFSAVSAQEADDFYREIARFQGLSLNRATYPGLGHGATLGASLPAALRLAAQIDASSK